jgi:hypothetical protein
LRYRNGRNMHNMVMTRYFLNCTRKRAKQNWCLGKRGPNRRLSDSTTVSRSRRDGNQGESERVTEATVVSVVYE